MNYEKLYYKFIEKWKCQLIEKDAYTEKHHIIPKHCGGGDGSENLVVLTYRQHTFAHKLLYKAYGRPQDRASYTLMKSIDSDKKVVLAGMAGKVGGAVNKTSGHMSRMGKKHGRINGLKLADNGHLDRIRHLANNEVQRSKASFNGKINIVKAQEVSHARLRTEGKTAKQQEAWDNHVEHMKTCPEAKDNMRRTQKIAVHRRLEYAEERFNRLLSTCERNEEFLHKKSKRSKHIVISPENLKFDSPLFAAKYYGNMSVFDVENWSKREQHGWHRIKKNPI